jgi:hypothetical protein
MDLAVPAECTARSGLTSALHMPIFSQRGTEATGTNLFVRQLADKYNSLSLLKFETTCYAETEKFHSGCGQGFMLCLV